MNFVKPGHLINIHHTTRSSTLRRLVAVPLLMNLP